MNCGGDVSDDHVIPGREAFFGVPSTIALQLGRETSMWLHVSPSYSLHGDGSTQLHRRMTVIIMDILTPTSAASMCIPATPPLSKILPPHPGSQDISEA